MTNGVSRIRSGDRGRNRGTPVWKKMDVNGMKGVYCIKCRKGKRLIWEISDKTENPRGGQVESLVGGDEFKFPSKVNNFVYLGT